MNDDPSNRLEAQRKREEDSHNAGYERFIKGENENKRTNNASNNYFGRFVKEQLLEQTALAVQARCQNVLSRSIRNASEIAAVLSNLIKADENGKVTTWFSYEEAAFLGIQLSFDNALNPNRETKTEPSKHGDKKYLKKQTYNQLEYHIGDVLQGQIRLRIIRDTFPKWFRVANDRATRPDKDGMPASTRYWEYNLNRAIQQFAEKLREEGDHENADLLERKDIWTYREKRIMGSLVMAAVLEVCGDYLEVKIQKDGKMKTAMLELTQHGKDKEQGIQEYVKQYTYDLLPMLCEPQPITNESLGGWLVDSLQEQHHSRNMSVVLSDRHLEFINRQARVKFQINPFSHQLLEELVERGLSLGKFFYQPYQQVPSVPQLMGIASCDPEEISRQIATRKADAKQARRQRSELLSINGHNAIKSLLGYHVLDKARKLLKDDYFYIPMKFCGRARIYSRVPFVSFQSSDVGRYLIRFAEQTPIDDRTEHWFKVGISNAAGNDKLCWDDRIAWFDKHLAEIINVGKMTTTGDFSRAYEFLTQDCIEDPFCFAALANEYVKVFVDKTQTYTQCFVCVDASCSGTSIFNSWRRNRHGAEKTNVVNTPAPADIYMAVWEEIRRSAPKGAFSTRHLNRLEQSKLLRKMMKSTYIPASYASPKGEQVKTLKAFNRNVLKPANLHFTDDQMVILCELWHQALDKVSSIGSVVDWFQERTREILASGKTEVKYTSCNGSVMTLKYPKSELKRFRTIHYGSTAYRTQMEEVPTGVPDKRRLLQSITANITHLTDSSALCEAMWDWEHPMACIHDACGVPIGRLLDDAVGRLKQGFLTATAYPVWDVFRSDNGLPIDALNAPPVIGDLDLNDILKSNYLFS
jgi:DNA-directed RNA polymerase